MQRQAKNGTYLKRQLAPFSITRPAHHQRTWIKAQLECLLVLQTGHSFSGSARAAQTFVQSAVDPMARIQSHFQDLITWINRPVVILVDDLDRCKGEYVVSLLEGIQTLFKDRRVIYVISADHRWLYCCFEEAYKQFKAIVNEPGRGTGYLFVEKAVQLSVSVPRLSADLQKAYWDFLNGGLRDVRTQLEEEAKNARHDLGSAVTEEEIAAKLKADPDPIRSHARRQEAVKRLSTERAVLSTAYFLQILRACWSRTPGR
jgi:hypothetical protein